MMPFHSKAEAANLRPTQFLRTTAAATTIGGAVEGAMRTKDNSGYRNQAIATIELMQRRQHPARAGVGQLKDRAATKSLALAPCVSAICGRAIEISRAIKGQTRLRIRSFGAGKAVVDGEDRVGAVVRIRAGPEREQQGVL